MKKWDIYSLTWSFIQGKSVDISRLELIPVFGSTEAGISYILYFLQQELYYAIVANSSEEPLATLNALENPPKYPQYNLKKYPLNWLYSILIEVNLLKIKLKYENSPTIWKEIVHLRYLHDQKPGLRLSVIDPLFSLFRTL